LRGGDLVKLVIELQEELEETEVIIRCGQVDDTVQKLQSLILSMSAPKLMFYKGQQEFYLPLEKILFFETDGEGVYGHTASDAYKVKHRLYELETILPRYFARAGKGAIVNTTRIYAINRNITSSSQISFANTHKTVYVSRHYYSSLKDKINERSKLK
jgi:DNA-binding LytR/AlgR family response regulator